MKGFKKLQHMKILIPNYYQKAVIRTLISEEHLPTPPLRLCETKKAMNYIFQKHLIILLLLLWESSEYRKPRRILPLF